jgi:hypothetical protein
VRPSPEPIRRHGVRRMRQAGPPARDPGYC